MQLKPFQQFISFNNSLAQHRGRQQRRGHFWLRLRQPHRLGLKEPGPPAANPQRRGAAAVQSHRAQGPDRFVALDVQGSGRDDVQDQERERWLSTTRSFSWCSEASARGSRSSNGPSQDEGACNPAGRNKDVWRSRQRCPTRAATVTWAAGLGNEFRAWRRRCRAAWCLRKDASGKLMTSIPGARRCSELPLGTCCYNSDSFVAQKLPGTGWHQRRHPNRKQTETLLQLPEGRH